MIDIHVQSALNKVLCIKTECRKEDEHFWLLCMHVLAGFMIRDYNSVIYKQQYYLCVMLV